MTGFLHPSGPSRQCTHIAVMSEAPAASPHPNIAGDSTIGRINTVNNMLLRPNNLKMTLQKEICSPASPRELALHFLSRTFRFLLIRRKPLALQNKRECVDHRHGRGGSSCSFWGRERCSILGRYLEQRRLLRAKEMSIGCS